MLRIGLFLLTNIAVIVVAGMMLNLLGVGHYLEGSNLNLSNLLIFCAVFGCSGALISLLLSKWMAKMATRTQVITEARSEEERWLLNTLQQLARQAGIGMPEVGIFPAAESNLSLIHI